HGAGALGGGPLPARPPGRLYLATTARRSPLERELLHDGENEVELGAPGLEVGLEEQLREAGLGVTLDVLADLRERAPQGAPLLALRCVVDHVRTAADDGQRRSVAADRRGGALALANQGRALGEWDVAAVESVAERDRALDDGWTVAADGDRRVRLLHGLGLNDRLRQPVELTLELRGLVFPDGPKAPDEFVAAPAAPLVRYARGLVFVARPSDAKADVEAP